MYNFGKPESEEEKNMDIKVDIPKLKAEIEKQFKISELKKQFDELRAGWKWNPFKDKTVWSALQKNFDLLYDTATKTVVACQKAAAELKIVEDEAKLEAAVEFLDDVVVLPFWMEFFDAKIFRLLITFVYKSLKKQFGPNFADKL